MLGASVRDAQLPCVFPGSPWLLVENGGRGLEDAQDWHAGEALRVAGGARGGQEAGGPEDA